MGQAQTVAQPAKIPLYSPFSTRDSTEIPSSGPPTKDSRLINGYAEKDQLGNIQIYKRFGTKLFQNITAASQGRGVYFSIPTSTFMSVYGGGLYSNAGGGGLYNVRISNVDNTFANFFFEDINTNPKSIILGDGETAYVYTPTPNSLQIIVDPNFPGNFVNGFVYLNGYTYVMDPSGNIWNSNAINNPITWNALNVIVASSNSDFGVALFKQLEYVVAFKQWTTQVFYDAGNPTGSPLSPVPEAQIPYGCLSGDTVQSIDDTLLWVTANKSLYPQVARMDNLAVQIISTPSVDRILSAFSDNSGTSGNNIGVFSWTLKRGGHRFYALNIAAMNITLVYDIDQDLWYFWTDLNGNYWPYFDTVTGKDLNGNTTQYIQGYSDGNLYMLDTCNTFPNDNGVVVPVDIFTPNWDAGINRRKMQNRLWFNADKQPGSNLQVAWSDDDYENFTAFETIDLGVERPYLKDLGTFEHRRAYWLRHQSNTAMRIRSMESQHDIGTL